jgi:hypothetical protein
VGALLVAVSVPVAVSRLSVNHDLSEANLPWEDSLEGIATPALVVPSPDAYLLFVNPFGDNGADLSGEVLFAADAGPELLDLLEEEGGRHAYLQRADRSVVERLPSEDLTTPEVSLTPLEVLTGDVHLAGTATAVPGAGATVWWVEVDGTVARTHEPVDGQAALDVAVPSLELADGLHTVEVLLGTGRDTAEAARSPLVRRTFYARASDGRLELLSPGTAARSVLRDGASEPVWEDALSLPELVVEPEVRAAR